MHVFHCTFSIEFTGGKSFCNLSPTVHRYLLFQLGEEGAEGAVESCTVIGCASRGFGERSGDDEPELRLRVQSLPPVAVVVGVAAVVVGLTPAMTAVAAVVVVVAVVAAAEVVAVAMAVVVAVGADVKMRRWRLQ